MYLQFNENPTITEFFANSKGGDLINEVDVFHKVANACTPCEIQVIEGAYHYYEPLSLSIDIGVNHFMDDFGHIKGFIYTPIYTVGMVSDDWQNKGMIKYKTIHFNHVQKIGLTWRVYFPITLKRNVEFEAKDSRICQLYPAMSFSNEKLAAMIHDFPK